MIPFREGPDGVSFAVRVQPRARRNAIVGEVGDALKIALTAPPVDGRANEACAEFFAEVLGGRCWFESRRVHSRYLAENKYGEEKTGIIFPNNLTSISHLGILKLDRVFPYTT